MKKKVKIGELTFEILPPSEEENNIRFEIENDASMVFVQVDQEKARELRDLLNLYIQE